MFYQFPSLVHLQQQIINHSLKVLQVQKNRIKIKFKNDFYPENNQYHY